ncbi:hypothetical protein ACUNV4_13630 [Granulosicoccus sp. 3-233]
MRQTWHAMAVVCLLVSSLVPASVHALEFQCELNGDIRYLRVDIPGENHLCEVSVKYEYTGERKVMWNAQNDSLFCSARAYELSEKYQNQWGFNCAKWPDHDGIDNLSPSQRAIVDVQLKQLISEGENAEEPFTVTAVKAVTSTLLDQVPGTLALQYFLSDGSDRTQVIADDKSQWTVFATIDDLAAHITGSATIDNALISSISDSGALEVLTTVATSTPGQTCHGKQILMTSNTGTLEPRSTHRFVCKADTVSLNQND